MIKKIYTIAKWIQTHLIPTSIYSRIIFKKIHRYSLNLSDPKTLNEKLQWMKLKGPEFINPSLVDKLLAREYIEKTVGSKYLIPLYAVYNSSDDFITPSKSILPVIVKPTHDSGIGLIYKREEDHSITIARTELRRRTKINHFYSSKEYPYKNLTPKIIVEKLLMEQDGGLPNDYKFHIFNGEIEFIYCSIDRVGLDQRHIYDKDWNRLDLIWNKSKEKFNMKWADMPKPKNFDEMLLVAKKLADSFPYIRVDLYNIDGKIYCGELTFFQGSGFDRMTPIEKDFEYGKKLDIKEINKILSYRISNSTKPIKVELK
jgi:hypothetical protein